MTSKPSQLSGFSSSSYELGFHNSVKKYKYSVKFVYLISEFRECISQFFVTRMKYFRSLLGHWDPVL